MEPVKQAVRENRQGKVRAAEYLILYDSPAVALLRSRMEVCVIVEAMRGSFCRYVDHNGENSAAPTLHRRLTPSAAGARGSALTLH